jgi:hypothetical protein
MKTSIIKHLKRFKQKSLNFKDKKIGLSSTEIVFLKSTPPKIAKNAKISTIIFNKGVRLPHGGVKINKDAFSHSPPETLNMKGFQKMAILSLKGGLNGVLNTFKGVLKEIAIFVQKQQMSQPPIFRFLDTRLSPANAFFSHMLWYGLLFLFFHFYLVVILSELW